MIEQEAFTLNQEGVWVWASNGRVVDKTTASELMKAEMEMWGQGMCTG